MTIHVQFFSVIIPIENIEKCQKIGGLRGILEKQQKYVGNKVLVDSCLYRDGAMGPDDIQTILDFWVEQGLVPFEEKDGQKVWKDMCVVSEVDGPTLPCDWLEFDNRSDWPNALVNMKGKPKGMMVSYFPSLRKSS